MTILVEHTETKRRYLLLGTGYGLTKTAVPGVVLGSLRPSTTIDSERQCAVATSLGVIIWYSSYYLRVVEVDGQPVGEIENLDARIDAKAIGCREYSCRRCGQTAQEKTPHNSCIFCGAAVP